jgi:hypothetical protein
MILLGHFNLLKSGGTMDIHAGQMDPTNV